MTKNFFGKVLRKSSNRPCALRQPLAACCRRCFHRQSPLLLIAWRSVCCAASAALGGETVSVSRMLAVSCECFVKTKLSLEVAHAFARTHWFPIRIPYFCHHLASRFSLYAEAWRVVPLHGIFGRSGMQLGWHEHIISRKSNSRFGLKTPILLCFKIGE